MRSEAEVSVAATGPRWSREPDRIAKEYRQNGETFLRELPDELAAAVLDSQAQRVIASSPVTGRAPLAFANVPEGTVVGSHVLELATRAALPMTLDETYLVHMLTGFAQPPPGTTTLRAVRRLLPGETLTIARGASRITRTDRLAARVPENAGDTGWGRWRDTFWETLAQALRRRTTGSSRAALALSAGIDSVTIASAMRRADMAVHAYAMVAAGRPDESQPLRMVEQSVPLTSFTRVDCSRSFHSSVLDALPLAEDPMFTPAPLLPGFFELGRAIREGGFDTIVLGEGGDELFWASPLHALREGRVSDAFRWIAAAGAWRTWLSRAILMPNVPRRLRPLWYRRWERGRSPLPSYFIRSPHNERLVAQAVDDQYENLVHRPMQETFERWLSSPVLLGSRIAQERMLNGMGLDVMAPLLDRRVVELALATPAEWLLWPGHDKAFLRRALEGVVPDALRLRAKDVRLVRALLRDHVVSQASRDAVEDSTVRARLADWIRFDAVQSIMNSIEAGLEPSWTLLWQLQCLVSFAQWYRRAAREYGVD